MGRVLMIVATGLAGALGGAVAADFLGAAPAVHDDAAEVVRQDDDVAEASAEAPETVEARDVVALGRRLVVPVVTERRVRAVALFDLAVAVPAGGQEAAYAAIPLLRDRFLRTMLSLSAAGTFEDGVADPVLIERVRGLLARDAIAVLGGVPAEVLVMEALMREV